MLYDSNLYEILGKEKLKVQNGSCLMGEWSWGLTEKGCKETLYGDFNVLYFDRCLSYVCLSYENVCIFKT